MMAKSEENLTSSLKKDISDLKKLVMLELYFVHNIPAELIAKTTDMNANSIRNMFPKEKTKGRITEGKTIKKKNVKKSTKKSKS